MGRGELLLLHLGALVLLLVLTGWAFSYSLDHEQRSRLHEKPLPFERAKSEAHFPASRKIARRTRRPLPQGRVPYGRLEMPTTSEGSSLSRFARRRRFSQPP